MDWDSDRDVEKLSGALESFDQVAARAFCDELTARLYRTSEPYPANGAKKILSLLRRKRFFAHMQRLAEAFIETGASSNTVRRLYAQALLDQSHITAALLVLTDLMESTEGTDRAENAEAKGLVGRAYKQLYVNANAPGVPRNQIWLDRAAKAYFETYKSDPGEHAWHGINVVAVADRGVRDSVPLATPGLPLPPTLATEILAHVEAKDAVDAATMWDCSTAAEASIALGKPKDALKWIRKYVNEPKADAFEFASTLRQLQEVWRLPRAGSAEEEAILSLLRATVLEREGGRVQQSANDVRTELTELARTDLEKVFGSERFHSLEWYRNGLKRCAAVARIGRETSRGVGTGFLLKGISLHPALGDGLFLLTNSHVISPNPERAIALRPQDAIVTFEGLPGAEGKTWTVKKVVFTSPIGELDATLVELDRPIEGAEGYPIAGDLPPATGQQRVYVVGHPLGGGLSFSLQDNLLLDWDPGKVHYRTPTEPGSSGSPVFDDLWRLIALHHAGRGDMPKLNGKLGTYEANEGINILAILAAIRKALDAD